MADAGVCPGEFLFPSRVEERNIWMLFQSVQCGLDSLLSRVLLSSLLFLFYFIFIIIIFATIIRR